jgi:hypothetical protein
VISARLVWNQPVVDALNQMFRERLERAGEHVRNRIRERISIRVVDLGLIFRTHPNGYVYPIRLAIRSKTGEPPRYDYGLLWQSYQYEMEPRKFAVRVGPDKAFFDAAGVAYYAWFLEFGTSRMPPPGRPHLLSTALQEIPRIINIIRTGNP